MKHVEPRPYADPDKAARRLMEHARAFEPVQDGRVYIEVIMRLSCLATRPRPQNMGPA
ncbi:hypothetical protein [Bradyrhizobium jicamae]|uniref:hypothetical protein n=1 Tax=Bradyrhizobium jicamae TaxID=280332 RepID=UPI00201156C3|nr:hypothetical protein [Bradyrhizobium jicamae]